ncbi:enoyl-CoA hydratase/isomerase family protein [Rhodococcus sp. USK10]|uniref:enoyl-CoA hydratase-related protein n=1 Tax=Rhodococcus sp. USK10 TaxID=2789739 RepID=UPI001C5F7477|nr:enoyl-CoA hydratase-related protein [Rhodococcus sp. USK10]QYB06909.1 enoyl-CoA hydratase/isomerase family protein [Rhodococcus sp. USK10]
MTIRTETVHEGVRLLTMDRPHRRNALDAADYQALATAIDAADDDPDVRVSVVTGAGGVFTSGNDIENFQDRTEGVGAGMVLLRALVCARKPIIAAVEGFAIGIGTTMLLHCDFAFAGRATRFRVPFVPLGLCPEGGSSYLLPQVAGLKRATELLMLGDEFDADCAAEAGLINRVVPDGDALEVALERAARLAAAPAESVELTKMLLRRPLRDAVLGTLDVEAVHFGRRRQSEEAQAAFAGFMRR